MTVDRLIQSADSAAYRANEQKSGYAFALWSSATCRKSRSVPHYVRYRTVVSNEPGYFGAMLHEFLVSHRHDLIQRCRDKVAARFAPSDMPDVIDHGVPLFIGQLVDALAHRPSTGSNDGKTGDQVSFPPEIGSSAALHGTELLRRGFTVDQVVHDYGDICQAITELAVELDCPIDPDDFRILNGCLDNAISGAVTSYVEGRQTAINDAEDERHGRLSGLSEEHRRLVDIATQSFTVMKTGNVGMTGATGALLMHALAELQLLADKLFSDVHNADAATSLRRNSSQHDKAT